MFMKMNHNHASVLLFQKALHSLSHPISSSTSTSNHDEKISGTNITNKGNMNGQLIHRYDADITYNSGLALLTTGRPLDAFKCFESCSALLHDRPQLWVRLAECCMQYDRIRRDKELVKRHRIYRTVASKGRSRRILVRYY